MGLFHKGLEHVPLSIPHLAEERDNSRARGATAADGSLVFILLPVVITHKREADDTHVF